MPNSGKTLRPGGTDGGGTLFMMGLGFLFSAIALYMLFDSVHVTTGRGGAISGALGRMGGRGGGGGGGGGAGGMTTSMGLIFIPLLIGVIGLFYDVRKKWAWGLSAVGFAIILIEIFSRIRFEMNMKTSHLMILIVLFAAGLGFILRSFRDFRELERNGAFADADGSDGGGGSSLPTRNGPDMGGLTERFPDKDKAE